MHRINGHQPPVAPPTAAETTLDPGILEMGTSVAVNNEMRRGFTTEIQEIEASISATRQEIETEENVAAEIKKQHVLSCQEAKGMHADSVEYLDKIRMNQNIFDGLQQTLRQEVVFEENSICTSTTEENSAHDTSPKSIAEYQQHWQDSTDKLNRIDREANAVAVTIRERMKDKEETVKCIGAILDQIATEDLKNVKTKAKEISDEALNQLKDEKQRYQSTQMQFEKVQARTAALEKQLKEMTHAFEEQKKANVEKEADLEKMLAIDEEKLGLKEAEVADIEKESALLDSQSQQVLSSITEATNEIAKRDKETLKLQCERNHNKVLIAECEELEKAVADAKECIEKQQSKLLRAQSFHEEILALKNENDAADKDKLDAKLVDAKAELQKYDKLLEAGEIENDLKPNIERTLQEMNTEASELDQELIQATDQCDKKNKDICELEQVLDLCRKEHEEKFEKIQEELKELQEVTIATRQRITFFQNEAHEAAELSRTAKICRDAIVRKKRIEREERKKKASKRY